MVTTVPVGTWPHGVSANPTTNRIYTADTGDSTVSVIQDSPNTPGGSNVTVVLNGGLGSIGGMQATFSSVTASGDTSVDVGSSGPPAPTAYQVVGVAGQPVYFDINTTATFSGTVTVCITYDQTQVVGLESGLKLMHYVEAGFVNITGSVDAVNNVVCGETTSLSPFAIVQPAQPAPSVGGISDLPDAPSAPGEVATPSPGTPSAWTAVASVAAAAGLVVLGAGGWYARSRWRNARGK